MAEDTFMTHKSQLLTMLLVGAGLGLLMKYMRKNPLDETPVENTELFIPESRANIDYMDRLSRYQGNPHLKNARFLSNYMTGDNGDKIEKIFNLYEDVKMGNQDYLARDLNRPHSDHLSNDNWRQKVYGEYHFQ